jgi:hypothetical protein
MRTTMKAVFGLAFAASVMAAPVAFANGCSGGGCKPASETKQGTTTNISGGTKSQVQTVTQYKDVTKVNNVTKYKDVTNTKYVDVINKRITTNYVQPIKRVVVVTRIQPVTRVKTITRVNTMTVYQNKTVNESKTVTLGARTETSHKTVMLAGRTEHVNGGTVKGSHGHKHVSCGC